MSLPATFALPDGPATLEKRLALELATHASAVARARVMERSRTDLVWWVDFWGWTFDPRETTAALPFLLYDFQRETLGALLTHITEGNDYLIEKSRDMGATWMGVAVLAHQWLFRPGFQALLGSRKESLVDNNELDSLFGKLAWYLGRLPGWMMPPGWDPRKHRRFLKISNPATGAAVIGESSNPNFARAGRYTCIFLDEAAYWPDIESVWRATGQSSPCRILVSTPNGKNTFYRVRSSGQIDVDALHWERHPKHDVAWYREQCRRLIDPVTIAQELDISYERSTRGVVYPGWADVPKGAYPAREDWPTFVALDFGIGDPTAIVWAQIDPHTRKVRIVDAVEKNGMPADFFVPFVTGEIPGEWPYTYTPEEREQIARHGTWPIPIVYGDPAGAQRSQATGTSVLDVWRAQGVSIVTRPDAQRFAIRYQRTGLLLPNIEGVNLPACDALDLALETAHFPERRVDTQSTAVLVNPVHDGTAHYRSALEYLAVNLPRVGVRRTLPAPSHAAMAYDQFSPARRQR